MDNCKFYNTFYAKVIASDKQNSSRLNYSIRMSINCNTGAIRCLNRLLKLIGVQVGVDQMSKPKYDGDTLKIDIKDRTV